MLCSPSWSSFLHSLPRNRSTGMELSCCPLFLGEVWEGPEKEELEATPASFSLMTGL